MREVTWDLDLLKARISRSHKYLYRTGVSGDYTYFYKLPSGEIVSGADAGVNERTQKNQHIQRLLVGREQGKHDKPNSEIARITGSTTDAVRSQHNRIRGGQPHEFEPHEIDEATHEDVGHPAYASRDIRERAAAAPTERETARAATRARAERDADRPATVAATPPAPAATPAPARVRPRELAAAIQTASYGRQIPITKLHMVSTFARELVDNGRTKEEAAREAVDRFAVSPAAATPAAETTAATPAAAAPAEDPAPTPAEAPTPAPAAAPAATPAPSARAAKPTAPVNPNAAKIAELRRKLKEEHGWNPTADEAPTKVSASVARATAVESAPEEHPAAVHQATERVRAVSAETPHHQALAAVDPDFATSETHVHAAETSTAANPYLERAQEIYRRIKGDLKPERAEIIKHAFNAMAALKTEGKPLNEANLLEKYKEMSGSRVRGLSAVSDEFEKGTFHSLTEVMENKPVNHEVERMKRGYGDKQYERMKPFIKDSWKQAHPDGPPPMPTFGDVKSWSDHAAAKPAWAGTTRLAVPEEVFNAAHKGTDGKPKYPPSWMPIHLMPAWNYVMAKAGDDAYRMRAAPIDQQGRVAAGNTAQYQEGIVISALRKYVQQRGGPDQLIDIPEAKLRDVGLDHAKIFKSDVEMSDERLKELLKTKVIDTVSLIPFIDAEIKGMKKSFALVIDPDQTFIPRETLRKSLVVSKAAHFTPGEMRESQDGFVIDIRKADRIAKIRTELARRGIRT